MPLRAAVISSGVAVFDSTSGGAAAAAVDSFAMMGETLAVQLLTELCWACLHAAVQLRAAVAMVAIMVAGDAGMAKDITFTIII